MKQVSLEELHHAFEVAVQRDVKVANEPNAEELMRSAHPTDSLGQEKAQALFNGKFRSENS